MPKNFHNTAAFSLAAFLMASASVVSAEELFTVSKKKHNTLGDVTVITVVSRQDSVVVQDLDVNRGNCPIANNYGTPLKHPVGPIKMKYGTEFTIFAGNFCNPLEISMQTDKGAYKTSWDR